MCKLKDITEIRYQGGYTYRILFDDGLSGEIDFECYTKKGPVFAPLQDMKLFKSARIEGGTISWPNGADIAPETLYSLLEQQKRVA